MNLQQAFEAREAVRELAGQAGLTGPPQEGAALGAAVAVPENFVSIGIGLTGEPDTHTLALRFLDDPLNHCEFIRNAREIAHGVELDIQTIGEIRAIAGCNGTARVNVPFGIGASIGYRNRTGGGTIGFFARRKSDGAEGLVSNNHVIALGDNGKQDEEVVYPSACDGGTLEHDVVAKLQGGYPPLFDGGVKVVDCAFAKFEGTPPTYDSRALANGVRLKRRGARLTGRDIVHKIGRTTRQTTGIVRSVRFDTIPVTYQQFNGNVVHFAELIEIESFGPEPFSAPGDSGSLVYDRTGHPVGLLFADQIGTGRRGFNRHYAIPITNVLTKLGLEIL